MDDIFLCEEHVSEQKCENPIHLTNLIIRIYNATFITLSKRSYLIKVTASDLELVYTKHTSPSFRLFKIRFACRESGRWLTSGTWLSKVQRLDPNNKWKHVVILPWKYPYVYAIPGFCFFFIWKNMCLCVWLAEVIQPVGPVFFLGGGENRFYGQSEIFMVESNRPNSGELPGSLYCPRP